MLEKLGGLQSRTSPALQTDAGRASQRHFPKTVGLMHGSTTHGDHSIAKGRVGSGEIGWDKKSLKKAQSPSPRAGLGHDVAESGVVVRLQEGSRRLVWDRGRTRMCWGLGSEGVAPVVQHLLGEVAGVGGSLDPEVPEHRIGLPSAKELDNVLVDASAE